MKTLKIGICGLMIIILSSVVSGLLEVEIDVKSVFYEGDIVRFDYEITTDQDLNTEYTPHIMCTNIPIAPIYKKQIKLIMGESYSGEYVYGVVEEHIDSSNCTATLYIKEPKFYKGVNFSII